MERDGKGRFAPGQSGNPTGRPKGALNRVHSEAKSALGDFFLSIVIPDLRKLWPKLSANQKFTYGLQIAPYFLEKLRSTYVEVDIDSLNDQVAGQVLAEVLKATFNGTETKYKKSDGRESQSERDSE